jgi:flavin-binding protein dodecin
MAIAKVTEISSTSPTSFEDAIAKGLARTAKTVRNIKSAWIKEQRLQCEGATVKEYQVNMLITFVLEEGEGA